MVRYLYLMAFCLCAGATHTLVLVMSNVRQQGNELLLGALTASLFLVVVGAIASLLKAFLNPPEED